MLPASQRNHVSPQVTRPSPSQPRREPPVAPKAPRSKALKIPRGTQAERKAVRAADASLALLSDVAHAMATSWHFPWRTRLCWPAQLRAVMQGWLRGDLAAARRTGRVRFCDILQYVPIADRSPRQHTVAAFALALGNAVRDAALHAQAFDGNEALDALEAVSCYLLVLRAQNAQVLDARAYADLGEMAQKIMVLVEELRGGTQAGAAVYGCFK